MNAFIRKAEQQLLAILPAITALLFSLSPLSQAATDPLPSWNESPRKAAVMDFVKRTTTKGDKDFIEKDDRIAVFDNDGTLWSEQPYYFQLQFALDRLKKMAHQHPEWKEDTLLSAAIDGDINAVFKEGEHGLLKLVMATHAGMSDEAFMNSVEEWIKTARHPRFNQPYTQMVFQPMLELLEYLRIHGYETWIISGGGIDFMRGWTQDVYGIPPQQIVGSSLKKELKHEEGEEPVIMRLPKIGHIDDKGGKPVGIAQHIGKRPVAAFGNSDGDLKMMQYVAAGDGPYFNMYIHHTDAKREWAYDRESKIGRLDKGLDIAKKDGWSVVDMKTDWKVVFPFETQAK